MKVLILGQFALILFYSTFASATETFVVTQSRALSKYEDGVLTFWDNVDSGTFGVLKCNYEEHTNVFEVQKKVGTEVVTVQTNEFDDYEMCLLAMTCARNGGPDQYSPMYIWIDSVKNKVLSTQLPDDRCPAIDQ